MATHVCAGMISSQPAGVPTFVGSTIHAGESMSESGSSTQSTSAISVQNDIKHNTYCWRVSAIGAAIYAAVGPNPVASAALGVYIPVGATEWIVGTPGDKVAIITA